MSFTHWSGELYWLIRWTLLIRWTVLNKREHYSLIGWTLLTRWALCIRWTLLFKCEHYSLIGWTLLTNQFKFTHYCATLKSYHKNPKNSDTRKNGQLRYVLSGQNTLMIFSPVILSLGATGLPRFCKPWACNKQLVPCHKKTRLRGIATRWLKLACSAIEASQSWNYGYSQYRYYTVLGREQ